LIDRRSLLAIAAPLLVSACGFEPVHSTRRGSGVADSLAAIRIAPIPERSGQVLRNYLLDRLTPLGQPQSARYTLTIRLIEPRQTLALRRDDVISRTGYTATASFELADASGKRIVTGISTFSADYEITNSEYANLMSRENARERVLELVGDDMRGQIAAYFAAR